MGTGIPKRQPQKAYSQTLRSREAKQRTSPEAHQETVSRSENTFVTEVVMGIGGRTVVNREVGNKLVSAIPHSIRRLGG